MVLLALWGDPSVGITKTLYMHPIFENFRNDVSTRTARQFKVIEISNRLQAALGIDEDQLKEFEFEDGRLQVGPYWILGVQRDFKPWVTVLEITEKDTEGEPGLEHTPSWLDEKFSTGVTTTNIPPDEVVETVLEFLEVTKDGL
jgi:hypothetical protein